jgi:hypothetical protein
MNVVGKGEERNLSSSNSSKKESREEFEKEVKKIKEEYSKKTHISLKMLLNLCYYYL